MLFEQQMQLMRIVDASGVSNSESRVKLPMVKLPSTGERRNGNASQKHPIDDSYQQRYSKQKFQYLVTSLSGNAVKVVESIELTENYEVA